MRFLYAKFTGYIGFYNGLGLSVVEIDFSKAKNKICLISGPNGVGKSTLINALTLMPDGNDCFVKSMNASKYFEISDGINLYKISFNHPLKNGERATTKVSIVKNDVELNSNGNVSSYKEIINSEFNLDNYSALAKMGGSDRGLADKTPAERKKILSSIIDSLEVYNDMYKNLNKKTNIFKSYINNLSTKIQSVGNEDNIKISLSSINTKITVLKQSIEKYKNDISEYRAIVKMSDPDGEMQNKYLRIQDDVKMSKDKADKAYAILTRYKDTHIVVGEDEIENLKTIFENENSEIVKETTLSSSCLDNISTIQSDIDELQIYIDNSSTGIDPNLDSEIESTKSKLDSILSDCKILDIDPEVITPDEITICLNLFQNIVDQIEYIYTDTTDVQLKLATSSTIGELKKREQEIIIEIENAKDFLNICISKINDINVDEAICSDIDSRPIDCKIDTCPYISSAVKALSKYNGSKSQLQKTKDSITKDIENANINISNLSKDMCDLDVVIHICAEIDNIMSTISQNLAVLKKIPVSIQILKKSVFINRIANRYSFPELKRFNSYLDIQNNLIEYKTLKDIYSKLLQEKVIQSNAQTVVLSYREKLEKKNMLLESVKSQYHALQSTIVKRENFITEVSGKIKSFTEYHSLYDIWKAADIENANILEESKNIYTKFQSSLNSISKMSEMSNVVLSEESKLKELEDQKKTLDYQIVLLDSYKKEYEMYTEKYNYIDVLKKYSSPTKGSIQSLFMSLYMDKTLDMVNQLLGMMFNGQYRILEYSINEDEFRIPFVGSGMPVDDISNGSTSQICIMGMIINLVLFNMGSSDFGIVSLDEIDGGLDQANRYMFVDTLQKIVDILRINQLFIISHNVESALSNVDVILLSDKDEYKNLFTNANIIYLPNQSRVV